MNQVVARQKIKFKMKIIRGKNKVKWSEKRGEQNL